MAFCRGIAFNFHASEDFAVENSDGWQTPGAAVNPCWLSHDRSRLKGDSAMCKGHVASMETSCRNDLLLPHAVLYSKRFEATTMPPMAPSEVFFRFQPTTCWLRGVAAPDIGNKLVNFMVSTMASTITKVNRARFSIKANMHMDGRECAVKLRMYSDNAHRALALEFQRRSGANLVLNKFYQLVREHLEAYDKSVQHEPLVASKGRCLLLPDSI